MDHGPDNLTGPLHEGLGLRFLNEEWNDSISNGNPFTIRWNESLDKTSSPELGLFKISYPRDGVVVYELISNLTDGMNNDNASCLWTPNNLDDNLYALWLGSTRDARSNWTTSPPWRLREPPRYPFHFAAPIIVPIVVLLFLYTMGLTTCVLYRRRKRMKREKQLADDDPPPRRDSDRHPSVDTVITIQNMSDSNDFKKPDTWLVTQSQSGSILLSPSRKQSQATLVSPTTTSPDQTMVSPISPSDLSLLTPTSTTSETTLVAPTNPREYNIAQLERQGRSVRVVVPTDDT